MRLDKRLSAVLDRVRGDTIADIGCDHGKLCCAALASGRARRAIATDISAASLDKARRLAASLGLELTCRHTDGLRGVDERVDVAIIAGMGAHEIVHILDADADKADEWVLLPHRRADLLREYCAAHGWRTTRDDVVECGGKYYWLLTVVRGEYALDDRRRYLGDGNRDNPDYRAYVAYAADKCDAIVRACGADAQPDVVRQARLYKREAALCARTETL